MAGPVGESTRLQILTAKARICTTHVLVSFEPYGKIGEELVHHCVHRHHVLEAVYARSGQFFDRKYLTESEQKCVGGSGVRHGTLDFVLTSLAANERNTDTGYIHTLLLSSRSSFKSVERSKMCARWVFVRNSFG